MPDVSVMNHMPDWIDPSLAPPPPPPPLASQAHSVAVAPPTYIFYMKSHEGQTVVYSFFTDLDDFKKYAFAALENNTKLKFTYDDQVKLDHKHLATAYTHYKIKKLEAQ